ncbi:DUF2252 domain-containing protein [Streptomyces sp. CB01881]|uniref:DUF2252 domain-containing protein n=1 Tax=Streptomyces sp. CB01881 TaxID=2078691 RepID=UPI000CDBBE93|nr:DUF2252 domain-containing protein [Streptomyces sp. CB01881]AUY52151.1 DUF2252 domain-containing protein [Streptomyces sp. CB01881]TYC71578.1 DUF2252 domain-containing protein [Streptomyces sp. CB01881]
MPHPQPTATDRAETILGVFDTAFGDLLAKDPAAFRVKFRKMAASAFAFYRGTAGLYYADLTSSPFDAYGTPFLDERTSRVWIHGDLHAENFGTYLNSEGRLVFNVNDFDEAYVGAFTWDVQRLAASLALIGYAKALSDGTITQLVTAFADAYRSRIAAHVTSGDADPYTLDTATGPVLETLREARLQTRVALLDGDTVVEGYDRRFRLGGGAIELDEPTKAEVLAAFDAYLATLPPASRTRPESLKVKDVVGRQGIGIGSAGLPSYNLLLEGHTDALENDVIIYMKQGQIPAVSRHVTDPAIAGYFEHEGHRTVISQRALQAHSDPWLGYTTLHGRGQLVAEVSPYATDLDWTDLNELSDLLAVTEYLGRATATMHAAADESSSGHTLVPFSTEHAIHEAIARDEAGFTGMLVDFAHAYGARARADHQLFVDLYRNGRIPGL